MRINELDVVLLKDGREATVVEVLTKPNEAYMLEFEDSHETDDLPIVTADQIEKVLYAVQ